jgi:signal transduction histidine kinase
MRVRIVGLVAVSVGLILAAMLVPLLVLLHERAELAAVATALARGAAVASRLGGAPVASLPTDAPDGYPVTVFLPDGRTLGVPAARPAEVAVVTAGQTVTAQTEAGIEVLVPARTAAGPAVVRVGVPSHGSGAGVPAAVVVILGLGVALVTLAVSARMARDDARALGAVARAADDLAAGDTSSRATPTGPPEARRLAVAVNKVAIRIDHLLEAERREGSDVAHRLRTPLTSLQLDLAALPESAAARALARDVHALTDAVTDVIAASRRRAGARVPSPVTLSDVVRERARYWSALAATTGRPVTTEIDSCDATINVSRAHLEAAVDALLGNVFAHTPAGTGFTVQVRCTPRTVLLIVEDRGKGFTRPDAVHRGRSGSGSTGLGLDIVRRTAESTGGGVHTGRACTGGARIEVTFVLDPAPDTRSGRRRATAHRRATSSPVTSRDYRGPDLHES